MKKKSFEEVNSELKLLNTSDWGIINGNADRLKEFIKYYNTNQYFLDSPTKFDYVELIISSMNEAILEDKVDYEAEFLFKEYIYENLENKVYFETTFIYWMSIADEEEFPVGFLLLDMIEPNL